MLGAIACFSMLAISSRQIGTELETFEILLFRSLIGGVFVVLACLATGRLSQLSTFRLDQHFVRNLAHFIGQNLWLFALNIITLSQLFALEFTSPIWVMFLSAFMLGEALTKSKLLASFLGFAGVCIITTPWAGSINIGLLCALGAAFFFAITTVYTKKLTQNTNTESILFWLCVLQAFMSLPITLWSGDITAPTVHVWFWVSLVALSGLMAHYCVTTALRIAPASLVMPIDLGRLPVIAVLGAILYSEPIDLHFVLGAFCILLANCINIRAQSRKT